MVHFLTASIESVLTCSVRHCQIIGLSAAQKNWSAAVYYPSIDLDQRSLNGGLRSGSGPSDGSFWTSTHFFKNEWEIKNIDGAFFSTGAALSSWAYVCTSLGHSASRYSANQSDCLEREAGNCGKGSLENIFNRCMERKRKDRKQELARREITACRAQR